ncbi:MAG: universal stress protein [Leptolyngbya sp. SIO1D8]|nr:universal stress protein [Leptolyngbya sp. SIO1D8]
MFSKILVALDHGDTCEALFKQAITLTQKMNAKLMLLSVLTPEGDEGLTMPSSSGLAYYSLSANEAIWEMYQKHFEEYETKGLEMLRSFHEEAQAAGVQAEFTQIFGSPGRSICSLARTWEADLVMVGSHGRKGMRELILGSVSNYVMHHAPCSVLVVDAQTLEAADIDNPTTETADLVAIES